MNATASLLSLVSLCNWCFGGIVKFYMLNRATNVHCLPISIHDVFTTDSWVTLLFFFLVYILGPLRIFVVVVNFLLCLSFTDSTSQTSFLQGVTGLMLSKERQEIKAVGDGSWERCHTWPKRAPSCGNIGRFLPSFYQIVCYFCQIKQ